MIVVTAAYMALNRFPGISEHSNIHKIEEVFLTREKKQVMIKAISHLSDSSSK